MSDFFQLAEKYQRAENAALNTFTTALKKQIEAFSNGTITNRSWAKEDGVGYVVKLGKLEKSYYIPTKEEVAEFFHAAMKAAYNNAEFVALVEAAYGEPTKEAPKEKRKYTRRAV
ncbi:hypothetical protein NOJ05_18110 [Neorhizobium galegae]|uniref:hypothetical protein n=1 Tax=Neorhizobium galegae TaxID=399 RepID=UPI00210519C5|nr:hypothetical protein [Neorhizobium galegae]MCQ1779122.1 hypothetical protein [Neorhizobium galegae]MCQ1799203.1 hypothetical protein [Neorhizobium galegae]